jgi:hypothetical protein
MPSRTLSHRSLEALIFDGEKSSAAFTTKKSSSSRSHRRASSSDAAELDVILSKNVSTTKKSSSSRSHRRANSNDAAELDVILSKSVRRRASEDGTEQQQQQQVIESNSRRGGKRKRTIRFSIDTNQVHPVTHIGDMSKAHLKATWFSPKELYEIRMACKPMIEQINNGEDSTPDDTQDETSRGVEHKTKQGMLRRVKNQKRATIAVFKEQERQRSQEEGAKAEGDVKIAQVLAKVTATPRTLALQRGKQDQDEIQDYLTEPCEDKTTPVKVSRRNLSRTTSLSRLMGGMGRKGVSRSMSSDGMEKMSSVSERVTKNERRKCRPCRNTVQSKQISRSMSSDEMIQMRVTSNKKEVRRKSVSRARSNDGMVLAAVNNANTKSCVGWTKLPYTTPALENRQFEAQYQEIPRMS